MKITCVSCQAKFNIPENKVPKGRDAFLRCPKCKAKVQIPTYKVKEATRDLELSRMFQSRSLHEEEKKALVCTDNATSLKYVTDALKENYYFFESADKSAAAIQLLAYYNFDVIILDEDFDGGEGFSKLMKEINTLDLALRRRTLVILLSSTIKTGRKIHAMQLSVNGIINHRDVKRFNELFVNALNRNKQFYSGFFQSLKATGRM